MLKTWKVVYKRLNSHTNDIMFVHSDSLKMALECVSTILGQAANILGIVEADLITTNSSLLLENDGAVQK